MHNAIIFYLIVQWFIHIEYYTHRIQKQKTTGKVVKAEKIVDFTRKRYMYIMYVNTI